jgi:Tfp pilus assembly PilM family ATPase/Tfp pilus assembly protein PilN
VSAAPEQPSITTANSVPQEKPNKKSSYLAKANEYLKARFCTEQEVIGVEIQPDMIRFCQAKQGIDGWKIEKLASINVLNNYQYENLKKNKKVYSKALKDLFEQNKVANKSVALAIPASIAIIKTISLPLMTRENLERATRIPSFWQNLVQISSNLAEYSIYYRIVKESPVTKEMDVLFIAAKHEDLKTYIDISRDAGLEPCVIDVGCFSINNISKLRAETISDLQVYMKVGRDENYLQVLESGKPYIYDIFVSDNEKSYLNEFLENQIFQQRFISQLKHIISKHEDKQKVKIDKISVISSEANIDKFINAVNVKLEGIVISAINLLDNIKLPEELINNQEFQSTKSSYAVSTGLSTRNLNIFADDNAKDVSETVNLLPGGKDIILGLKAKFYSKIALWGTVFASMVFILLFGVVSIGKHASVSAETAKFNELNKVYQEKQKAFNEISTKSGTFNKLIKIKDSLKPNQQQTISGFAEISAAIPEGVWVEEISIDNESKITITGRSFEEKGIIAFSKSFDESKTLENISISSLKSTVLDNGSLVKEFVISGKFKDGANGS